MKHEKFAQASISEMENLLQTSINRGLSSPEIEKRRKRLGIHEIKKSTTTWLSLLIRQFASPFLYLLMGAVFISFLLGEISNGIIILVIIAINTGAGFIQEFRAERSLRLLSAYLVVTARVLRDGIQKIVESKDLIEGDIIFLGPGDAIPADARLIETESLTIDESALTGESMPQTKMVEGDNVVFLGTTVVSGSAKAIVLATGADTAFGEISMLTLVTPHKSSFQANLLKLSHFFIKLAFVMLFMVLGLNLLIKGSNIDIIQLLIFCVVLAISVTPEALPIVITFALTEGAFKLAQKKVIVKRLSSIEDLGSITLLCTDKTGTLTENKLTVVDTLTYGQQNPAFLTAIATSASSNSFEQAALLSLNDAQRKELSAVQIIRESPFDPVHRITSKLITMNQKTFIVVKGVLEEICSRCATHEPEIIATAKQWERDHGLKGERVLAVALKELKGPIEKLSEEENNLTLIGFIAFEDPLKPTVHDAIKKAASLGLKIKILTGDSAEVAGAVAARIGLIASPDAVILGSELDALPLAQRYTAIDQYAVFARVTPQQKFEIIEHLKLSDTVGFLGDGVNDAPGLKAAHVGIVVAEATDIARSAADIVLVKKSLAVIIDGIIIGRTVFANTVKYIKTTLASNVGNFYSIAIASFFIDYLPMLPIQILLVDLLSDAPMIAVASDNVDPEELHHPTSYNIRELTLVAVMFGLVASAFDLITFSMFKNSPPHELQSSWYLWNLFAAILFIFSMRTRLPFFRSVRPSRTLVILAIIVTLIGFLIPFTHIGQTLFQFTRPTGRNLLIIAAMMVVYITVTEIIKVRYYKSNSQKNKKVYTKQ